MMKYLILILMKRNKRSLIIKGVFMAISNNFGIFVKVHVTHSNSIAYVSNCLSVSEDFIPYASFSMRFNQYCHFVLVIQFHVPTIIKFRKKCYIGC